MCEPSSLANAALAYCRARREMWRAERELRDAQEASPFVDMRQSRARLRFEMAAHDAAAAWQEYLGKDKSDG